MNCQQVEDLIPMYVAGGLRVTEAARLEAHLTECHLHDTAMDALHAVAYMPASEIEELAAPTNLKSRIMTAVRAEGPGDAKAPEPRRAPRLRPQTMLVGALAAAVLALAGMFAWNLHLRSETAAGNETFTARLAGEAGASGFYYYAESVEGVVVVDGLAPLPSDKTYQVWATTGNTTVSCGLLAVAQTGSSFARMSAEMNHDSRVFVTVEPAGGSATPTGATVLSNKP